MFRPVDVKIILVLSLLVLAGSVLTLLKRQRVITSLNLGIFNENSPYDYSYDHSDTVTVDPPSDSKSPQSVLETDELPDKMDINQAGFYDLQTLPGIGPVMAERIIDYRDSVGTFRNIEELMRIRGIGPGRFANLKDKVTVR